MGRASGSAVVVVGLAVALGALVIPAGAAQEPVRIGAGFALSGKDRSIGEPAARGAMLGIEEISAAGGVLGGPVELIVRDSTSDPAVAAENARRAVTEDAVDLYLGFTDTDPVLTAGPILHEAGIPFLVVGATSPLLPATVGDRLFLVPFGDNTQAAAGVEYAVERFGTTAALLWDEDAQYPIDLARYARSALAAAGGTLVLEATFADRDPDLTEAVAQLRALETPPDFLYVAAMPYNVGTVLRQLRDGGLAMPVVGGDGYDTPELLTEGGAAADGAIYTTHALMDPVSGSEPVRRFIADFAARHGEGTATSFAALGYDAALLAAAAIEAAGSTDPDAIVAALEATTGFPGITGTIGYAPGVHVPEKSVAIVEIVDGVATPVAEVTPRSVPAP